MASNMVIHGRVNPLRTCKILKEAFLLPGKNPTLILSVFLICSLASSIYLSAYLLAVYHLVAELGKTSPSSSAYYDLIKLLIFVELVFLLLVLLLTYVLRTITIYALAGTYTGKLLTFTELRRRTCCILKGPFITQLFITFLGLLYVLLLAALWVGLSSAPGRGSVLWIAGVVVASAAAAAAYLYLAAWWSLSITVSVLEQGCYGAGAMRRAAELMGEGRRWTGVAIVGAVVVVAGVLFAIYCVVFRAIPRGVGSQLGLVLVYNLVMEVLSLFSMAAIAVYYYECRGARGEDGSYERLPAMDAV